MTADIPSVGIFARERRDCPIENATAVFSFRLSVASMSRDLAPRELEQLFFGVAHLHVSHERTPS